MDEKDEDFTIGDEDLDDSVVAEESAQESVKKLRGKLKDAEAKAKEYLDGWQRAQADFANMRKRDEESKQEFLKFAKAGFLTDLIPVLDSFNIALSKGHKDLEPIYNQFLQTLKSNGLEEMDPLGESFDPSVAEAISMVPVERKEDDHKVVEVAQKGYSLAGKVVRPAKVIVGEYGK